MTSDTWKHRIILITGAGLFVCSVLLPALAPILGPSAVKVMAIGGALALVFGNIRTALGASVPAVPPAEPLFPKDAAK